DGEDIPQLVSGSVLLKEDPLAVGRPGFAILPLVRLCQLYPPSAVRGYLPQVRSAGYVGGEHNLFAIWRPGRAGNGAREIEIVNRNGTCIWIGGRHDRFGIGDGPRIWPR